MFQNDIQLGLCCRALLAKVNCGAWWKAEGGYAPGPEACRRVVRKKNGEAKVVNRGESHGQTIMLAVAFDFWNGDGRATIASIIKVLDERNQSAITTLMQANLRGPQAIWSWLSENWPQGEKKPWVREGDEPVPS